MSTIEIAVSVSVFAFVVLVIFICRLLHKTTETLVKMQKQIDDLGSEPKKILQNANQIVGNVKSKMHCLDPLFLAISNVGEGLEYKTSGLATSSRSACVCRLCKARLETEDAEEDSNLTRYARLALRGAKIWQDL